MKNRLQDARALLAAGATLKSAAQKAGFRSSADLDRFLWRGLGRKPTALVRRPVAPWTRAEERRLAADWGRYPLAAIACAFGRSEAAIRRRAKDLGLTAEELFPKTAETCGALNTRDVSHQQIT